MAPASTRSTFFAADCEGSALQVQQDVQGIDRHYAKVFGFSNCPEAFCSGHGDTYDLSIAVEDWSAASAGHDRGVGEDTSDAGDRAEPDDNSRRHQRAIALSVVGVPCNE